MLQKLSGKYLVLFAFVLLFVMGYQLSSSYNDVQNAYKKSTNNVKEQRLKKSSLSAMYDAGLERSFILLLMSRETDDFELDDLNQRLSKEASKFLRARQVLFSLEINEKEKQIVLLEGGKINKSAALQQKVAYLFIAGKNEEAVALMLEEALPAQDAILKNLKSIIQYYEENFDSKLELLDKANNAVITKFKALAFVLIGGGLIVISFLIVYISKREKSHLKIQLEQQINAANKLSFQASHDSLTGLVNRREFENRLQQLLLRSEDKDEHAILYLDLDQFKIVNDTCGHHAGDELLKQIPDLITQHLRSSDLLARVGGDEFSIILMSCELEMVKSICDKIIQSIAEFQFFWEQKIFKIGVSIGVVQITDDLNVLSDILRFADTACYSAKEGGRGKFTVFEPNNSAFQFKINEMDWLSKINHALESDLFVLYAQAIVPTDADLELKSNYEILIRMSSDVGIVLPGAFLPAAERYDQMIDIDRWVVINTLAMIASNPKFMANIDYISINLSGLSLANEQFLSFVIGEMASCEFSKQICFEITETAVINNLTNAKKAMKIMRGMGVLFSLDDFGSGLSSFAYLKSLEVDYLKIDGAFVKDIVTDPLDRVMVKSVRDIATVMGKKTIAEFVENDEILQMLKGIGIDYAQGYGIAMPKPFSEVINDSNV